MPFTVSHAAAVLPLRRIRRLPWAALVLGSFGPDFEYFLRFTYKSRAWHYFPDILLYCLPFILACYYLFHAVIKRPVARLLPVAVQQKINFDEHPYPTDVAQFAWLVAALLIGLATHVAWDALTHPHTWPWQHIEALRQTYDTYLGREPGYSLAQTLSSIFGLIVMMGLAWWSLRVAKAHDVEPAWSGAVRGFIAAAIMGMATAIAWWHARATVPTSHPMKSPMFHYVFLIGWISCLLWGALGFGVVAMVWEKRGRNLGRG